ncbi:unnamed protein product [Peniophora sp. CBMAI 1063]|nr:unnamed protein product [Peniophora sp. CBMAI 1063]
MFSFLAVSYICAALTLAGCAFAVPLEGHAARVQVANRDALSPGEVGEAPTSTVAQLVAQLRAAPSFNARGAADDGGAGIATGEPDYPATIGGVPDAPLPTPTVSIKWTFIDARSEGEVKARQSYDSPTLGDEPDEGEIVVVNNGVYYA